MLLLADLYYQRLSLCGCKGPLSEEALMELFPKLQANISTGISKVMAFHDVFSGSHLLILCVLPVVVRAPESDSAAVRRFLFKAVIPKH